MDVGAAQEFALLKSFHSQDASKLINGLRICGIYIQWNLIQS
jgi:hypothetical protein